MHFFHGDIKPGNTVLNKDQTQASFIDFGLSRIILKAEGENYQELQMINGVPTPKELILSSDDIKKGTPEFLSPEIADAVINPNLTRCEGFS